MYNDTLTVANKIIIEEDLLDIFYKMWEDIEKYKKICKQETMKNEKYERKYQIWTAKNFEGVLKFTVDFYDDTAITFDHFQNFVSIFNNRLDEIKKIWVRYSFTYWIQEEGKEQEYIRQSIEMDIQENKMSMNINLNSQDKKMGEVYQLIKNKILASPEKYDRIIRKRRQISNKVSLAFGMIPSMIILALLAFVPIIMQVYSMSYIGFPLAVIVFGFTIGRLIIGNNLEDLYKNMIPEQKYVGYDKTNYKGIYKDDIERFTQSSEILIGKNVDNIKNRVEIKKLEEKYTKYLPAELIILIILSIIIIIMGTI